MALPLLPAHDIIAAFNLIATHTLFRDLSSQKEGGAWSSLAIGCKTRPSTRHFSPTLRRMKWTVLTTRDPQFSIEPSRIHWDDWSFGPQVSHKMNGIPHPGTVARNRARFELDHLFQWLLLLFTPRDE